MIEYYRNTNPAWIPLFKQFMESKGRNEYYYNFSSDDLFYYVDHLGVINATEDLPCITILFNPLMMKIPTEIKIVPPINYEIDRENSTFEYIKFKKKELTYEDIANSLFSQNMTYFSTELGAIDYNRNGIPDHTSDLNNATSEKQIKKLFAINKLMNIAKYFNSDWKPKFGGEKAYFIYKINKNYHISHHCEYTNDIVYFKSREDAEQAIKIMGKDLDLIFCTDW